MREREGGGTGEGGGRRKQAPDARPDPIPPRFLRVQIMSAAAFDAHLASAPVVVVDFMARWCRKCIYVKPRLVALMKDKFPHVPLAFVDVNGVPSDVVREAGVSKMPTLCVYVKGEQVREWGVGVGWGGASRRR